MLLSDIGKGSSALFCLTDRTRCCSTTAGGERHGAWRFPSGSEVGRGGDIYRDRSYSSIILSRRNNAVGPTGIYICTIPSEADSSTTLYIGVYGSTHPELAPPVVTLSVSDGAHVAGENYRLTCEVIGGGTMTPTYRWFRNGSPLSGQTSATLSFSPLRQSDSGSYSCETTRSSITVRSTSTTITVEGKCS